MATLEERLTMLEKALEERLGLIAARAEDVMVRVDALKEGHGEFAVMVGRKHAALEDRIAALESGGWTDEIFAAFRGQVDALLRDVGKLSERLDHLSEVQRANQQGMGGFQQAIVTRLAGLEARWDLTRQSYGAGGGEPGGALHRAVHEAIRDRSVIVGSFTWAVMQARRGAKVRRSKWPDAGVWATWSELVRELDICPDEDLMACDWVEG